jgi:hypothetical protein
VRRGATIRFPRRLPILGGNPVLTTINWDAFTLFRIATDLFRLYSRCMKKTRCKICLVEHDEEIHAATVSLHEWLRDVVRAKLYEAPAPEIAAA